jgi:hypothetical protein
MDLLDGQRHKNGHGDRTWTTSRENAAVAKAAASTVRVVVSRHRLEMATHCTATAAAASNAYDLYRTLII